MNKFIRLETDRLIIRDHVIVDLDTHNRLLTDQTAMYYLPELKADSYEESALNLMEAIEEITKPDRTKYFLRIEDKNTKEHIGEIGYTVTDISPAGKFVNLGYFTYPKFWNKGYTSEAVRELLRFAFEENDVVEVYTGCIKDNIGSERVMQKCGLMKDLTYSGTQLHDGREKERVSYRMTRIDWMLFYCLLTGK